MPLGATVAFSSIAGRFGNPGQTDYSAANDLLCKMASSFRATRPEVRAIAIDWTAWGGIGMASRGSIPKVMEMAGIEMLPPEAGIPLIRRELTAGATSGEVVIGGRLGVLLNEWDATGGLDAAAAEAGGRGPMIGKAAAMGLYQGLTIETTLDPKVQPFLYDHKIDGTAVLPGAMGIEAFGEAARWALPGWSIDAIEDVNFLAPFKFYRDEPRVVSIEAVLSPQGEGVVAECRLIGRRTLPGQKEPQVTTHFTARVRLTRQAAGAAEAPIVSKAEPTIESAEVYRLYFHGPAYRVIDHVWWEGDRVIARMSGSLPDNHHPREQPLAMAPRLIELCFQTAGIWEMGSLGRMGLPMHVDRVTTWRAPERAEGALFAVVGARSDQETFDADVVDAAGNLCLHVSGYRTAPFREGVEAGMLRAVPAATA
jgi:hypothetical protein